MRVSLDIEDRESWLELFRRLKKFGFLENISEDYIDLDEEQFPVQFFIDVDPILNALDNPIVRPFRKKFDIGLSERIREVIG